MPVRLDMEDRNYFEENYEEECCSMAKAMNYIWLQTKVRGGGIRCKRT